MGEKRRGITADLSGWLVYAAVTLFVLMVGSIFLTVLLNSFASSWFGGWLPDEYTGKWYAFAVNEFSLWRVLLVTLIVALSVTAISLVVGVPAAYALARRRFRGKSLVLGLLILPLLVPPITYGIPLATMLYEYQMAGTVAGVILANLAPALPFVVLIMTPFIEQIDPNLERAARMMGAPTLKVFTRVLLPLAVPGLLAAGLLVLVRTVAMFELTFLTAGAGSQTLVVALYYAAFSAGIRPGQSIDAMAVIYMATTLVLLIAALRFVNPTNMVMRVR
ncbi:MAG TPA: ABC transporter permease subunit [Rubrobacteraceae bacterium]|jgi:putative spermidine/putrescine transport system permease protein